MQERSLFSFLAVIAVLTILYVRGNNPINDAEAKEWIEEKGYTDVQVKDAGRNCYAGSSGRSRHYDFSAKNQVGIETTGVLCLNVTRRYSTIREK